MSIKIISYDLGGPENSSEYKKLIEFIESLGDSCKPLESFWLVKTDETCTHIRDEAKAYLDNNDRIFVGEWSLDDWAVRNLKDDADEWLGRIYIIKNTV